MKNMILLITLLLSFSAPQIFAEQAKQADPTEEAQLAKEILQKQKKLIVLENLNLTTQEQEAFLPVYSEYQQARTYNNEALGRLIVQFAENYENMDDAKALKLLNDVLVIRQGRLDIKKAYVDEFKKVLPGKKVARYYQIESKLEALAEVKLAEIIPLLQ